MKKVSMIIILCLACVGWGKTDIFGDGREVTVSYGEDVAQLHIGFVPLANQRLSWGGVVSALTDDAEVDENIHVDSWMAGVYIEYPFVQAITFEPLPNIESEVFAGLELQYAFERDDDVLEHDEWYLTPYVGWEAFISKNLSARIRGAYNRRDDMLDEYILSAGIAIRW